MAEQEIGKGKPGPGRGRKTVAIGNRFGSNSAEYLVRRLKRDYPEIAQALARGEYKSARAAGIAAGIVRIPTAGEQLRRCWVKCSAAERADFLAWVNRQEANGGQAAG